MNILDLHQQYILLVHVKYNHHSKILSGNFMKDKKHVTH